MGTEISTMTIEKLEDSYKEFSKKSRDDGKKISSTISMLQLDEVSDTIVNAVKTIEDIVARSKEKSFMSRVPLFGKYFDKATDSFKEENMKNSTVTETIDRLFKAMSDKQSQISGVMKTLFETRERLIEEHSVMLEQERYAIEIAQQGGMEGFKARNLLVQLQQAIIKTQDRVSIIDATLKSAEASSLQISGMLPTLQGELITEMSIQAGLKELQDYKEIFDKTVEMVEDINETNSNSMQTVLSNVAELAVLSPVNLTRLENTQAKREKFQAELRQKMNKAHSDQVIALEKLQDIREKTGNSFANLLTHDEKAE